MWHAPVLAMLALAFAALSGDNAYPRRHSLRAALDPARRWSPGMSASRPRPKTGWTLPDAVSSELRKIARRTWRYFETFVDAPSRTTCRRTTFQETPHVDRGDAHVSDQYRRLPAVRHFRPPFRLVLLRGNHRAPRADDRHRSTGWRSSAATCSTGITPTRWRRLDRATSRRSTAATSPAT